MRILIVEGDSFKIKRIRLKLMGHLIDAAKTQELGLALCASRRYDAVFFGGEYERLLSSVILKEGVK